MKYIAAIFFSLAIIPLCIGCASAKTEASNTDGESSLPDGYTEVYCKVKEINGNEITVVLNDDTGADQRFSADRERSYGPPDETGGGNAGRFSSDNAANGERIYRQGDPPSEEGGFRSGRPADGGRPSSIPNESGDGGSSDADAPGERVYRQGAPPSDGERPSAVQDETVENSTEASSTDAGTPSERVYRYGSPPSGESRAMAGRNANGQGMTGPSGGMDMGEMQAIAFMTFNGEETSYTIPVTASVTTGQNDSARTVSFTQIAVKNILKLTLDESGRITSVRVLQ